MYVNGELVLTTSLIYSASSQNISVEVFKVSTVKGSSSVALLDNMYAHRYFRIYEKEAPAFTPEDESEVVGFDSVGSIYLPATITSSMKTVEDGIRVVEEKKGEIDRKTSAIAQCDKTTLEKLKSIESYKNGIEVQKQKIIEYLKETFRYSRGRRPCCVNP